MYDQEWEAKIYREKIDMKPKTKLFVEIKVSAGENNN